MRELQRDVRSPLIREWTAECHDRVDEIRAPRRRHLRQLTAARVPDQRDRAAVVVGGALLEPADEAGHQHFAAAVRDAEPGALGPVTGSAQRPREQHARVVGCEEARHDHHRASPRSTLRRAEQVPRPHQTPIREDLAPHRWPERARQVEVLREVEQPRRRVVVSCHRRAALRPCGRAGARATPRTRSTPGARGARPVSAPHSVIARSRADSGARPVEVTAATSGSKAVSARCLLSAGGLYVRNGRSNITWYSSGFATAYRR